MIDCTAPHPVPQRDVSEDTASPTSEYLRGHSQPHSGMSQTQPAPQRDVSEDTAGCLRGAQRDVSEDTAGCLRGAQRDVSEEHSGMSQRSTAAATARTVYCSVFVSCTAARTESVKQACPDSDFHRVMF